MVYITDYTEKAYKVPTEFRDHFDPSRSAITEPTKIMDSNRKTQSETKIHEFLFQMAFFCLNAVLYVS